MDARDHFVPSLCVKGFARLLEDQVPRMGGLETD